MANDNRHTFKALLAQHSTLNCHSDRCPKTETHKLSRRRVDSGLGRSELVRCSAPPLTSIGRSPLQPQFGTKPPSPNTSPKVLLKAQLSGHSWGGAQLNHCRSDENRCEVPHHVPPDSPSVRTVTYLILKRLLQVLWYVPSMMLLERLPFGGTILATT
eukprot:2575793-Amphidinium_carterae.1